MSLKFQNRLKNDFGEAFCFFDVLYSDVEHDVIGEVHRALDNSFKCGASWRHFACHCLHDDVRGRQLDDVVKRFDNSGF